jgi:M6 family metalloprotease-like protein
MSLVHGEVVAFPQQNGPDVRLAVFGDEFSARYETAPAWPHPGFSVIYDRALGRFCYAALEAGRFVSSGASIAQPPPPDLKPHLREDAAVRASRFDRAISRALPSDEVFGPNKGLLAGRQASSGAVRGLTVLVNFSDVQAAIAPDEVEALLNGESYQRHGNACSVRDYYRAMSAGKLDFSNVVVGPVTLSGTRRSYVDTLLAEEALALVVETGIDLAQFDARGEGILDAVSFFYAGETLYEGWLWPHNHVLDWRDPSGSFKTNFYQTSSLGLTPHELKIGTFCHEAGHMLCRFPDLYDYGRRDGDEGKSAGMGAFCLMSSGNHLGQGKTPSPICAYLRHLAGWAVDEVALNDPGAYTVRHGDYGTFHLYRSPRENEYFLLENRSRLGLDGALASSGLAILHCDTLGSNEWQGNSTSHHYQCRLLQADALESLERNENSGDEGDLFRLRDGDVLHADTTPGTRWWDGSDSGLRIRDISADGDEISFTVY